MEQKEPGLVELHLWGWLNYTSIRHWNYGIPLWEIPMNQRVQQNQIWISLPFWTKTPRPAYLNHVCFFSDLSLHWDELFFSENLCESQIFPTPGVFLSIFWRLMDWTNITNLRVWAPTLKLCPKWTKQTWKFPAAQNRLEPSGNQSLGPKPRLGAQREAMGGFWDLSPFSEREKIRIHTNPI